MRQNNKRKISAVIIADSVNPKDKRLTTAIFTLPRMVLAELNTHRQFSRNSASSRAVPFNKMLRMVMTDPFIPIAWMKDHSGMQGNEYFTGFKCWLFRQLWLTARNLAVLFAWLLSKLGLTKQIVNRLMEPFMWHTAIVTGSDWLNFFALRAHPAAEIHFQELANAMLEAYNNSLPKSLKPGEWHIPFGDRMDMPVIRAIAMDLIKEDMNMSIADAMNKVMQMVATARVARVSYVNFDGSDDYRKDVQLYNRLVGMSHLSPLEHVAMSADTDTYSGNLCGFVQLRKLMPNENKADDRVVERRYSRG